MFLTDSTNCQGQHTNALLSRNDAGYCETLHTCLREHLAFVRAVQAASSDHDNIVPRDPSSMPDTRLSEDSPEAILARFSSTAAGQTERLPR